MFEMHQYAAKEKRENDSRFCPENGVTLIG